MDMESVITLTIIIAVLMLGIFYCYVVILGQIREMEDQVDFLEIRTSWLLRRTDRLFEDYARLESSMDALRREYPLPKYATPEHSPVSGNCCQDSDEYELD